MMMSSRRFLALFAVASLAFIAYGDRRASAAPLSREASSDEAGATGQVRAVHRADGDRLVVSVANVTPGRALVAVVVDADGNESSLGSRTASGDGHAFWSLDTALWDALPFDAATVDELEGYALVVRDATGVILTGTIPEPVTATVDQEGREGIPRAGAPEGTKALVRIAHRTGEAALEVFAVRVTGFDEGTVLDVWLEVPDSSGEYANVGTVTIGADGTAELEQTSSDGNGLPFDVSAATDLAGLRIQVRDEDNSVFFAGFVPEAVTR